MNNDKEFLNTTIEEIRTRYGMPIAADMAADVIMDYIRTYNPDKAALVEQRMGEFTVEQIKKCGTKKSQEWFIDFARQLKAKVPENTEAPKTLHITNPPQHMGYYTGYSVQKGNPPVRPNYDTGEDDVDGSYSKKTSKKKKSLFGFLKRGSKASKGRYTLVKMYYKTHDVNGWNVPITEEVEQKYHDANSARLAAIAEMQKDPLGIRHVNIKFGNEQYCIVLKASENNLLGIPMGWYCQTERTSGGMQHIGLGLYRIDEYTGELIR